MQLTVVMVLCTIHSIHDPLLFSDTEWVGFEDKNHKKKLKKVPFYHECKNKEGRGIPEWASEAKEPSKGQARRLPSAREVFPVRATVPR